jgi:hypothetical protein
MSDLQVQPIGGQADYSGVIDAALVIDSQGVAKTGLHFPPPPKRNRDRDTTMLKRRAFFASLTADFFE